MRLLSRQVTDRFARMSMTDLQAIALPVSELNDEDPARNPSHPACVEFASSDYCHESWLLHLARLKRFPGTHWGVCQYERICAMIPVVAENRCLAVVKLAGPSSLDKAELKRLVDLLELLVRDFTTSEAKFLRQVPGGILVVEVSPPLLDSTDRGDVKPSPTHPQVARALEYIATHLSDPRLTVARLASVLGLCPTYLSEIFVDQVGQRMSRFIAAQRVERAKKLLVTTDWQVKRIALETGHANPNWFSHVFHTHTGLTPGEYRAAAGMPESTASNGDR